MADVKGRIPFVALRRIVTLGLIILGYALMSTPARGFELAGLSAEPNTGPGSQQQSESAKDKNPSSSPPSTPVSVPPNPQQPDTGAAATASSSSKSQETVTGCLRQSGGKWTLATNEGQTLKIYADNTLLAPHDGKQVQLVGTDSNKGFSVTSVSVLSDTCNGAGTR